MRKMNITNLKNHSKELIVFLIFCCLAITVSAFHEPWFDEFQAWAISKDTLYNILFVYPHYEGHSPLWHLILKCFSYFNVNSELTLKIPNLLFMISAVALLIFKSPFPNIVKFSLPFTYFIFYQFSAISRPYCIFVFALFLCATLYKNRNKNPFKFVSALVLLGLSCAYGMIVATGIIFAWLIEIFKEYSVNFVSFVKSFVKDKRFFSMLIIFFCFLLLSLLLIPYNHVYVLSAPIKTDYWVKSLYSFFGLVADATFFDFYNYKNNNDIFWVDIFSFLKFYSNNPSSNAFVFKFWSASAIGFLINSLLIYTFYKAKKLTLFLIPWLMFALFCAVLYITCHHIGLYFCLLIFMFWCLAAENINPFNNKFIKPVIIFTIIIQILWSLGSFLLELYLPYDSSRYLAKYIKTYHLDKYKIMTFWAANEYVVNRKNNKVVLGQKVNSAEDYKNFLENYKIVSNLNLMLQWEPVSINPYFNKNIFYIFNLHRPGNLAIKHLSFSPEENLDYKYKIQDLGLPDIIIGRADIDYIFDNLPEKPSKNYIGVKNFPKNFIFKSTFKNGDLVLYMRQDLYDNLKSNNMIE